MKNLRDQTGQAEAAPGALFAQPPAARQRQIIAAMTALATPSVSSRVV